MDLIKGKDFLKIKEVKKDHLPFCLQEGYILANKNVEILIHNNSFAPVKINKNKFLKTLQFQFSPIQMNGESLTEPDEKIFCETAIEFIKAKKIAHRIVQPKNHALFKTMPSKSTFCNFGTYRVALSKTHNEILENMQARYRSAIRQIEKLNVEIRFGASELEAFQKLHKQTMQRTSAYAENLQDLQSEVNSLPKNVLIATVYIDKKIQGGVYLVYSEFAAYYFHGASADTTNASGAIKYLHYKLMCLMREKDVGYYDFVGARLSDVSGTKLEGIQNFKKRFGSELVKGYLWKIDIDKPKCKAYDNLLKIKCKLKGVEFPVDIIDQEKNKKAIL